MLAAIDEDAAAPVGAAGTPVSSLIDATLPGGGLDNVVDVDGDAPGIALTGLGADGTWYYSLDGAAWQTVPAASDASALLLAPDARLAFVPANNFNGASSLTFRAWDGSSGSNGSVATTQPAGGTSAYSVASDTASITVTPVNDAPVITTAPTVTAREAMAYLYDADASDGDGPGGLAWNLEGAHTCDGTLDGASGLFAFTPSAPDSPPSCQLALRVCDDGVPSQCASQGQTITITANALPSSTAPAMASVLEDQTLAFVGANALQAGDADSAMLMIELATSTGTLDVAAAVLAFEAGDGSGDASMRFTGAIADINAALATLTLSPAADYHGAGSLQFDVDDGIDQPLQRSVALTVMPVNDAPTLDSINGTPAVAGSGPRQISLTGIGPGNGDPLQTLSLSALSDTPSVIAEPQLSYLSPGGTAQLTFTPLAPGTAQITVMVLDDGGTADGGVDTRTRSFVQTVLGATVFGNGFEGPP